MSQERRHETRPGYHGFYIGFVTDREDPLGLGRVRIRIPGLIETPPFSNWAWPLGVSFGGTAQRGFFAPPIKGASVGILFWLGDLNRPFYLPAHWAQGEVPTGGVVDGDTAGNYPMETKAWLIEIDDRSPEVLRATNKATGDKIEFNGTDKKATIDMAGKQVVVDGVANKITLEAGTILLGAAAVDAVIKGTTFKTFLDAFITATFNTHTHLHAPGPGAPVPTGPPVPTGTPVPASALSTKVKVE